MINAKEISIETIAKMSQDSSINDIIEEIHLIANVMSGLEDVENQKTISTKELLFELESWHK